VIILHERYGFVQHPRDVAEHFAELGMIGLAINAFYQCDYQSALGDGSRFYYFTDEESVRIIEAALDSLDKLGRADMTRVAVLGMCQTGRHPIVMAAESKRIAAAICWYGAGADREFEVGPYYSKPLEDKLARAHCPLLGMFGENDVHIPLANVRRMRDILERHGKAFEIHVHADAPHGFLNNTMAERYRPEQAAAAWRIQMDFLDRAFRRINQRAPVNQTYVANLSVEHARPDGGSSRT
jgi:carboxymethylenebutenolidase